MPPIPVGIGGSSLGSSVTTASAVVKSDATPAASVKAVLTTYTVRKKYEFHTLFTSQNH